MFLQGVCGYDFVPRWSQSGPVKHAAGQAKALVTQGSDCHLLTGGLATPGPTWGLASMITAVKHGRSGHPDCSQSSHQHASRPGPHWQPWREDNKQIVQSPSPQSGNEDDVRDKAYSRTGTSRRHWSGSAMASTENECPPDSSGHRRNHRCGNDTVCGPPPQARPQIE